MLPKTITDKKTGFVFKYKWLGLYSGRNRTCNICNFCLYSPAGPSGAIPQKCLGCTDIDGGRKNFNLNHEKYSINQRKYRI